MASHLNFSLVLCYFVTSALLVGAYSHCIFSERKVLLDIKASFPDPNGYFASWNTSDCCMWVGVTCANNSGHVVALDLANKDLGGGTLSPSIANLSFLEILDMESTGLSGPLPSFLGFLPKLRVLSLGFNGFNGTIPESFAHLVSLEDLRISVNQLTGGIPSFLGNLLNLRSLVLAVNDLKGKVPASFGNLGKLKELDLQMCNLHGTIPASFKNLQALEQLHLGYNSKLGGSIEWLGSLCNSQQVILRGTNIHGSIPSSLSCMSKLQSLDLSSTSISGIIPDSIGSLSSLQYLDLSSTNIFGSLPDTISGLYSLQTLRISDTKLSGSIPESLGKLSNLQELLLSGNHLSGSIPESLGSLHNLTYLALYDNALSGAFPSSEKLSNLKDLYLDGNQITALPANMSHFTSLSTLSLGNNKLSFASIAGVATLPSLYSLYLPNCGLTGDIPNIFPSSIGYLGLSHNSITGLQADLSSLQQLGSLDLGENLITLYKLQGLGRLARLQNLVLSTNRLQGDIKDGVLPFSLVDVMMDNNKITGLPDQMSNFSFLSQLNLENNELNFQKIHGLATIPRLGNLTLSHCGLRGQIPRWLAALQMWGISMRSTLINPKLDLSFNYINGTIPVEFVNNTRLGQLMLQNNLLSGRIPSSLADMKFLNYINMSNNKLSGHIPKALAIRDTIWGEFNVSNNNLSGKIPQGPAFNYLGASSFKGNPGLCGHPLPPC